MLGCVSEKELDIVRDSVYVSNCECKYKRKREGEREEDDPKKEVRASRRKNGMDV